MNIYEPRFSSPQVFLILLTVGLLTFGQTLFYPFVHDDVVFIKNNPSIANLTNLSSLFIRPSTAQALFPEANAYYRPLLEIFNRLQYRVFHFNSMGYHAVNVGLHILNSFLVYLLAGWFTKRVFLSFAAAVLFLVHPVQPEAVACVSGNSNL